MLFTDIQTKVTIPIMPPMLMQQLQRNKQLTMLWLCLLAEERFLLLGHLEDLVPLEDLEGWDRHLEH